MSGLPRDPEYKKKQYDSLKNSGAYRESTKQRKNKKKQLAVDAITGRALQSPLQTLFQHN